MKIPTRKTIVAKPGILGSGILPDEARHFVSTTKSTCLLVGQSHVKQAGKISELNTQNENPVRIIPISSAAPPLRTADISIDDTVQLDPKGPGLVLWTSGSTGAPKAAVLPRQCFAYETLADPDSTTISFRPPHWLGGATSLLMPVLRGMKNYILKERADARVIWEVLKENKIISVSFTPTLLRQLKEIYTDELSKLTEVERQRYLDGFKNILKITSGGAMVSPTTRQFWTSLSGKPFENIYISTEIGTVALKTSCQRPSKVEVSEELTLSWQCLRQHLKHSVGTPAPGVDIRLSEGDHGEILVKSPWMLTQYVECYNATSIKP